MRITSEARERPADLRKSRRWCVRTRRNSSFYLSTPMPNDPRLLNSRPVGNHFACVSAALRMRMRTAGATQRGRSSRTFGDLVCGLFMTDSTIAGGNCSSISAAHARADVVSGIWKQRSGEGRTTMMTSSLPSSPSFCG